MPALYPEQKQRLANYFAFLLIVVFTASLINVYVYWRDNNSPRRVSPVIDVDTNVTVTANAVTEVFNFQTIPDDRIGDLTNTQNITIRNCANTSNSYTYTNIPTDIGGFGTLNIPANHNQFGSKRVIVRGFSHLNKDLGCIDFDSVDFTHYFNQPGEELTPGEVSNVYDNYINSLDASGVITDFTQTTVKYDLNLDGTVDGTDLDILLNYLYQAGD